MKWYDIFTGKFREEFSELVESVRRLEMQFNAMSADINGLKNSRDTIEEDLEWRRRDIGYLKRRIDYTDKNVKDIFYKSNWQERFPRRKEMPEDYPDKYMDRKEVMALLDNCDTKLNEYKRDGWFDGFRCGREIYYSRYSVKEFMEKNHRNARGSWEENED